MREIIGGEYADLCAAGLTFHVEHRASRRPASHRLGTQISRIRSTWNTRCSTADFLGHQEKSLAFHMKHLAYTRRLC
jgi:hypothetical protein